MLQPRLDALPPPQRHPPRWALGAAAAVHCERFNPIPTLKALTFFGDGDLSAVPESD